MQDPTVQGSLHWTAYYLQEIGRVYSASRFISWGVGPLGAMLAAIVGEVFGIRVMFTIGRITSVCLLLLFLKSFPPKALDILDKSTN